MSISLRSTTAATCGGTYTAYPSEAGVHSAVLAVLVAHP